MRSACGAGGVEPPIGRTDGEVEGFGTGDELSWTTPYGCVDTTGMDEVPLFELRLFGV